jgi:hypothetical protein
VQTFGAWNLSLGIIGYSFPKYDEYALQALYGLCRNYIEVEPTLTFNGRQKSPLRVIDFQSSNAGIAAFKSRRRFLDWSRVEVDFSGFSEQTANWILT